MANSKNQERFVFTKRSKISPANYPGKIEQGIASQLKISCAHTLHTICLPNYGTVEVCEYEKPLGDELTFEYLGCGPIVLIPILEKNESVWNDGEIVYLESGESWSVLVEGGLGVRSIPTQSEFQFNYSGLEQALKNQLYLDSLAVELTCKLNEGFNFSISHLGMETVITLASISKLRILGKITASEFLTLNNSSEMDHSRLNWYLKYLFGSHFKKYFSRKPGPNISVKAFYSQCSPLHLKSIAAILNSNGDLVPQSFLNELPTPNPC